MDLLLRDVGITDTRGDPAGADVTSITLDSRTVSPGALFCCLPGQHGDGHDHAPGAVAAGAAGLLVERPLDLPVPQGVVGPGRGRRSTALLACAFEGHPAASLLTVGVTGTNGKTTVTSLLRDVLRAAGRPTESIGTLDGARTTPEAPELQRRLRRAVDGGAAAVVMEVSSHALVQHRVDGFRFDVAAFTNLSHDHLDFHRTMEEYFAAKARLFTAEHARAAVVNVGDPWGRRLAGQAEVPVTACDAGEAEVVAVTAEGTELRWRGRTLRVPLVGDYHVANVVVAATVATVAGVGEDDVAEGLAAVRPVPGRFELIPSPAPFRVVVDYAHTPDGLRVALDSARSLAGAGRVLVVFGCGGDRDREKRPAMGAVAAAGADLVVVTADNSREEPTATIIDAVLGGIDDRSRVLVEPDRREAIARALGEAAPGDVVLVAGKGHETTLTEGGRTIPFDDRLVAAELLAAGGGGAP